MALRAGALGHRARRVRYIVSDWKFAIHHSQIYEASQQMNKWKSTLSVALTLGVIAVVVTFTQFIEFSAMGQFAFVLGAGFGVYVVWDQVLLKDVDTIGEVVNKQNLAYALLLLIPVLLVCAAAVAIG